MNRSLFHGRKPRHNTAQQRGSTVFEALLAFSVLALASFALINLQTDLRYNAALSQQRLQASRLAQQQIENWRAKPSTAPAAKTSEIAMDSYSDSATPYQIKRQITWRTFPALAEIKVWVEWKDQRQQTQQWTLHSLQSTADTVFSGALALSP
jgi:Tfp pilus assembly protein PilV